MNSANLTYGERRNVLSRADKGVYSRESNARPVLRFLIDLNTVEGGRRLVSGLGARGRGGAAFFGYPVQWFWG